MDDAFVNDLLSNRSAAAMARDAELEIAKAKISPVDLRTMPLSVWDNYIDYDVVIPEELQHMLDGCSTPLDKEVVHAMEIAMERLHNVKPPYYIAMSLTLQQTGRPWRYVPDASLYLTGFTLGKE
jgi:hypothetical protein